MNVLHNVAIIDDQNANDLIQEESSLDNWSQNSWISKEVFKEYSHENPIPLIYPTRWNIAPANYKNKYFFYSE